MSKGNHSASSDAPIEEYSLEVQQLRYVRLTELLTFHCIVKRHLYSTQVDSSSYLRLPAVTVMMEKSVEKTRNFLCIGKWIAAENLVPSYVVSKLGFAYDTCEMISSERNETHPFTFKDSIPISENKFDSLTKLQLP